MSVPTKSLNNMKEGMTAHKDIDRWLEPEDYRKHLRLIYIKSFNKPLKSTCPECDGQLESSDDEDEILCTKCGLVVSASIEYAAGVKIILPYGRR